MSIYILIHGAWHGGWCWDKVVPLLEEKGHRVVAPDLPGHGNSKVPISEVSLQAYTDHVCEILDDQAEPVILVGHSMGGVVISQVAEYRPEKVKTLVYLTALLLQNGESLLQALRQQRDALLLPNLIMSEDRSYSTIKNEAVKELFYGDCSDEDVERAKIFLCPQAESPVATPIKTSGCKFGRVPRVYIECLNDQALIPSLQKKMYSALPCNKVIPMSTSHSPFFSAPVELVNHLLSL